MPVPVVSIAQMRVWETASWKAGRSEHDVIRNVGRAVARTAANIAPSNASILILAGKGNNGADARAAAEFLEAHPVRVIDVRDPTHDHDPLFAALESQPEMVIDGLFGIGLNRPLNESWIKIIECLNGTGVPILSIDVPSGLNADSGKPQGAAIEASVTLTVAAPKTGLVLDAASRFVGRLEVATETGLIDSPVASGLNWTLQEDFHGFPPGRRVGGHKGLFGRLAIIAGSLGYHGAAVLAARGAQRAQPGLISLFTHPPAYPAAAAQLQAVMVHPWTADKAAPEKFDAILIGPGLAALQAADDLKMFASELWVGARTPVVADASALDWLPANKPSAGIRVITPHPGEAARLLNTSVAEIQSDRVHAVRELSARFANCWVVLKGHHTIVGRNSGDLFINPSGNPHLGQGGTGDLLAGYIAGFLAQPAGRDDVLKTLRFAVWQHGASADRLTRLRTNWVVEDLAATLGIC